MRRISCIRSASLIFSRKIELCKSRSLIRKYNTDNDLPNAITDDMAMDPALVKIPYLRDELRQEMYLRHIEDPVKWSIPVLSQTYGTGTDRTKAIIFLMQSRVDFISKDVSIIHEILGTSSSHVPTLSNEILVRPSLSVPPIVHELYTLHLLDTTVPLANLIDDHNTRHSDDELTIKISDSDLRKIFDIVDRHSLCKDNQEGFEEEMEEKVEMWDEMGADTNTFRETSTSFSTSKASNFTHTSKKHFARSFQGNYYPQMLNDDDAAAAEQRLLRRIVEETKAQLVHDPDYYHNVYGIGASSTSVSPSSLGSGDGGAAPVTDTDANISSNSNNDSTIASTPAASKASARESLNISELPPALMFHQITESPKLSRWKLAFQDLSDTKIFGVDRRVDRKTGSIRIAPRTIIRTRDRQLRYASPIEESKRSWRVRPSALEVGFVNTLQHFADRMVVPYTDVDNDEAAVKQMAIDRKERRKALIAAAKVK